MAATSADPLVPVAFAPDQASAESYVDALAAAGIEAHVRIEDGAHLSPTGSAYGAMTSGDPFVYPVFVSRLERRLAQRVIEGIARSEAAPTITSRTVAVATGFVVGSMLLVLIAAWARGDV